MKDLNNSTNSQSDGSGEWEKLLHWLRKGTPEVQLKALKKCIKIITKETKESDREDGLSFPTKMFNDVLVRILSPKKDNTNLIAEFHKIANHPDVVFHFWRCIPKIMLKEPQTNIYHMNLLEFIEKMALPKNYEDPKCIENKELLFEKKDNFTWKYDIINRSINKVWGRTKSWTFSHNVKKKHLIVMVESVMPHLKNLILWTDYIMSSINQPGSIAFIALQAAFKLMTKFNIEVPNIYGKLYNMFQPEVFHSRFKQRLFYLTDLFLSSTHIPQSMIASFIKRCSRLALVAPAEDICIIFTLISDLMIRHPGLKTLIDNSSKEEDLVKKCKEDPFLEDETDPMNTKAIHSSLWEIRTLEMHLLPMVASASKFIRQNLPALESGIASKLEETSTNYFNRELKRKYASVPLNFERPKKMALPKEERVEKYWDMLV